MFTRGRSILEARRVQRAVSSDLVLYWSTKLDPYSFYKRCSAFEHAPALKERIEIIADDDILRVREDADLRVALANRSLVRFNFADWTIIWLAEPDRNGTAEIQALVNTPPAAMTEMVKQSITGFRRDEVERFFEELRQAA